jgi:hypothetical protein
MRSRGRVDFYPPFLIEGEIAGKYSYRDEEPQQEV